MAKTNFTKVEGALDEGLRKMMVERLYEEAGSTEEAQRLHAQKQLVQILKSDLKKLNKLDHDVYVKLGFDKKSMQTLMANAQSLTPEEWMKLKEIMEKVTAYKKELLKHFPQPSNEQLIEQERHKHINKRFNVNEKWLPLK